MGVSHIVVKKRVYSGRMGIFWEDRISKGGGYILGRRGRFWEHRITPSCRKGGYILERWGRFWEPHLIKRAHSLEGRGGL